MKLIPVKNEAGWACPLANDTNVRPAIDALTTEDQSAEGRPFLCKVGYLIFVSHINLHREPDHTMAANCNDGCIYVDPKDGMGVRGIHEMDEIYMIEE